MINSEYFKVDHEGRIEAENADIDGIITAKELYIGEYAKKYGDDELIDNGDCSLGNNLNFTNGFSYELDNNTTPCFKTTENKGTFYNDSFIPVDADCSYSVRLKTKGNYYTDNDVIHYCALACYDYDKNQIFCLKSLLLKMPQIKTVIF